MIEEMRMELDLAGDYLRKLEDSFETGRFARAEDMAVLAILHMKRILRKLAERHVKINDFDSSVHITKKA